MFYVDINYPSCLTQQSFIQLHLDQSIILFIWLFSTEVCMLPTIIFLQSMSIAHLIYIFRIHILILFIFKTFWHILIYFYMYCVFRYILKYLDTLLFLFHTFWLFLLLFDIFNVFCDISLLFDTFKVLSNILFFFDIF